MGSRKSKLVLAGALVTCTSLLLASSSHSVLPEVVAPVAPFWVPSSTPPDHSALSHLEALRSYTRQITVRVMVGEQWGTGTLIQRWGSYYRIVTNRHVLPPGQPYQVEMPDGQVYPAALVESAQFPNRDLALLQVQSDRDYTVAKYFADSSTLMAGTTIVATGFPFDPSRPSANGFRFTVGLVSLIADQELKDGYQIGYTNDIVKGMSGGPVLDWNGLLVGINGMHAYPLWGSSYNYLTGEPVNSQLSEKMTHYSWAIPINVFTYFAWSVLQQDPSSFSPIP